MLSDPAPKNESTIGVLFFDSGVCSCPVANSPIFLTILTLDSKTLLAPFATAPKNELYGSVYGTPH